MKTRTIRLTLCLLLTLALTAALTGCGGHRAPALQTAQRSYRVSA